MSTVLERKHKSTGRDLPVPLPASASESPNTRSLLATSSDFMKFFQIPPNKINFNPH